MKILPLSTPLADPNIKEQIVDDFNQLIESHLASLNGISALIIKSAYTTLKKIKKNAPRHYINEHLEDFAIALEPWHQQYRDNPQENLKTYFSKNQENIIQAIINTADKKMNETKNQTLIHLYKPLKAQARTHIKQMLPQITSIIEKYTIVNEG